ncbi:uncharacterized protein N7459_009072 [Penicillium hispanicum]|uniref:uncharacterized protein n=1 Tax=Penicillium hispanicum TaxID=1080232 RepID=UPI0025413558|nr:uncharacterized protein N7459_009072 [Penicillium hispanicum]KAJ5569642.1 hypothetical protein N7459_009072 [Penicillium hispanicum]
MASNTLTLAGQEPLIIFISLTHIEAFDRAYASLIFGMKQKAKLLRFEQPSGIKEYLLLRPKAVLLTDDALTWRHDNPLCLYIWDLVLRYVRNGGTVVCMGMFPSCTRPQDIKPFFSRAGLSWDMGDYHRTTVHLNKAHVPANVQPFLSESYSLKGMFLKGVDPTAAWYLPAEDSVNESIVWARERVNTANTPVAMAKVGDGYLGFVGDCNGELGSFKVILAMCGLCE